jgi:hypothetical protein
MEGAKMMYRFVLIPLFLLSAGCATPLFPEGIPTAMIRFTANAPVVIGMPCERDRFVKGGFIKNPYTSEMSPVKMYGTRGDKNNEVIERLIPAERTLPFRVMWGGGVARRMVQCVVVFSIRPAPHEQYQADYVLSPDGFCALKMYRLSEKNGAIEKTEMPVKRYPAAEKASAVCPNET